MSYWKGVLLAVVFDVACIMGNPTVVKGPELLLTREPNWVMTPETGEGVSAMQTSPEDAQLDEAGRLEDSLMLYLQGHEDDVATMVTLAQMYVAHGWYDAAIGPLARAAQLDPSRRASWSLLDRALKQSGMVQITDAELTNRARQFVESVRMWGQGC